MKTFDYRFTSEMIEKMKSIIGHKFIRYECDKSVYCEEPDAYIGCGLFFDNSCFELHNEVEPCAYLATATIPMEDYVLFSIKELKNGKFDSYIENAKTFIGTINEVVRDIKIVTDNVHSFNETMNEKFITDIAVIFCFDTFNLTFQRQWMFSEAINITKTDKNVLPNFCDMNEEYELDDELYFKTTAKRTIHSILKEDE